MQTITGTLFQELALVVVFSLACSLFVALTLVPMLASRFMTVKPDSEQKNLKKSRFQRLFERTEKSYGRLLKGAINRKYVVYGVSLLLFTGSIFAFDLIPMELAPETEADEVDRKSTRLNSSHVAISYAVFCLKKKTQTRCHTAI